MKNQLYSYEVAELINKENKIVMRDIRNHIQKFNNIITAEDYFIEDTYTNKQNRIRPCYMITIKGVKLLLDNYRKSPDLQSLIDWYNKNTSEELEQIILTSRFEDSFVSKLSETLDVIGYQLNTQYNVLGYKLDGYIEELNIAIEYDEGQHSIASNNELDKQRQLQIYKKIGCKFIRCDYMNTDAYNIGLVIKEIMKNIKDGTK